MVRALLARLWPFSAADPEKDDPDAPDEDDGPIRTWDFIPNWQYTGWQAETGGMTVDEQEKALADVQAQAEAIEEAADEEPPNSRSSRGPVTRAGKNRQDSLRGPATIVV